MSALFLAAIGGTRGKTSIAFSADGLFAVKLLGKKSQGRIVNSSTEAKHKMESGFLLDIVITQCSSVFELFPGKDKTLLIRGNSLLILDLRLYIIDSVTGFDIKSDGLTREGLYKDLHGNVVV